MTTARQLNAITKLARRLREAEYQVEHARNLLDSDLYYAHEGGVPVAHLAEAAGLSRETVYKAIDRHRATL